MAGAVINHVPVTASVVMPNGRTTSSQYTTVRISVFVDRLRANVSGGSRNDNKEICRNCVYLSRCIDYAVGNNEIYDRAAELPLLLKQVCQRPNDTQLQTGIMMLVISIKGACRNGWFSEKDNEEVKSLWSEMTVSFCSVRDMNSGESTVNNSISAVLSRFYPRMKMGTILAFIEAMPGYGAFVKDFHLTKNANSPDEKLYLFVAQIDNTETSSCLTSPQLVNFLLNGKAVDGRTCIYKDPGPQIPTDVTDLVKYGTNLLQAVGQFNGKYFIAVAFMSTITNPSFPDIPDYMPPVAAAYDSDNEIVEGASIISLNCPISYKRITTPVKGHLCKHLQCVDFENYVDINTRRPSWRCPHCGQSVCFTDIRIDQGMAKVLKEVGDTISHVKFSAYGSWQAVNDCDDHADKQKDKSYLNQEPIPTSNMGGDIMDLTEGDIDIDIDIDASNSHQETDKKPSLTQLQDQPTQIPSHVNMNRSYVTISQGQTVSPGFNNTHAIGSSNTVMNLILQSQSQSQTQISASRMQFQPQNMNIMSNNDYGQRYTTPNRHVTRMVSGDSQQQFGAYQLNNWVHHDLSYGSTQPAQQFGAHSAPYYQSSGHNFNSYQQSVNHTIPNSLQSPYLSPTFGQVSNQQTHHYTTATASQGLRISNWTPHIPAPLQTSLSSTPVISSEQQTGYGQAFGMQESSVNQPADQNWRPTGRMRGSLSGQAYSEAYNQSIVHPTQPILAASPPVLNTPRPYIPPHLQVLIANNRNANAFEDYAGGLVLDGNGGA